MRPGLRMQLELDYSVGICSCFLLDQLPKLNTPLSHPPQPTRLRLLDTVAPPRFL